MKNKYIYLTAAVIAFIAKLSLAVQIVPLPAGTAIPKPRVDFKVMKEDANLYGAKSAQGAKARLHLATYRYQNAIGDDAVNLVEAAGYLREVLEAIPANRRLGAEARILLADLRRQNVFGDDVRDIAAHMRVIVETFPDDLGTAARVRLILFRTEGLVGDDVVTLDELARLIGEVEGRQGVGAGFITTARNDLDLVRLPYRQNVHTELGADARNQLAYDRIKGVVDDTVITFEAAAQLLREVIGAFGPKTPIGARARLNLAVMRIFENANDNPVWLAHEMGQVAAAFPANTLQGGGARLNLVNLRLHRLIGDAIITLNQVDALLGEIEEDLAQPEFQPAVEEARGNLQAERALVQPEPPMEDWMLTDEVPWTGEPLPDLFDLQLALNPDVAAMPLPTIQLQPVAPLLNVNPTMRTVVTEVGLSIGNVFAIAPQDAGDSEPPQKRGKRNLKKRR